MISGTGVVVVGMSGGVDSAVAAYVLQQQGRSVHGIFMKNWEDDTASPAYRDQNTNGCSWEQDAADARAVCDQLGIPFSTFNFVEEYKERVFRLFLEELKAGRTPNPDILCNQEIKFFSFMKKALSMPNVVAIATGHYAAIRDGQLQRPKDKNKDQTYFLHRVNKEDIQHIIFPLQDYTKDKVRAIAGKLQFPNAQKKDSTGICFIGDIDYRQFVQQYIEPKPGAIITTGGEKIGHHDGLHLYTIGQRKGINIGGTGPYYVVRKNKETNELVVTDNQNDRALFHMQCTVNSVHWIEQRSLPINCMVQIRYRQQPQPATLQEKSDGNIEILFNNPQRAITEGQSAVWYDGDIVLGGGIIESAT